MTIFTFSVLAQHPELKFIYENYNSKIDGFISQYSATNDAKSAHDTLKKLLDYKLDFFNVEKKLMDQYEFDLLGLYKNPPNGIRPVIEKKIALEKKIVEINKKKSEHFKKNPDFKRLLVYYTEMHLKKTKELQAGPEPVDEMIVRLKLQLLKNLDKIKELIPNHDIKKSRAEPVRFTMKKFGEFINYDAIKFKVPPEGGKLIWAFTRTRKIDKWYIVAKDYNMKKGFKNYKYTSKYFLQELESWNLVPETYYIIWFKFNDTEEIGIDISLNIVTDDSLTVRELVDYLKKNTS
jgi:hypothetical protein